MIKLHQLRKRYPGSDDDALANVSFELDAGEMAFITGTSGSGKTSLLRVLLGVEPPSGGQALVGGLNLSTLGGRRLSALRRRIGFVFQDFRLLPDRTAVENVELPLQVRGVGADEARRRALRQLGQVGVAERADAYPQALSAGERQRVAVARALVGEPALLLADEPTGNLDPELAVRVMKLFVDAQVQGTSVLVATHDPGLIHRFRRREIRLEAGRILDDVPAEGHPGQPTGRRASDRAPSIAA